MSNAVVIVSLGPGDPELITLKGLNRLRRADRIFTWPTRNFKNFEIFRYR